MIVVVACGRADPGNGRVETSEDPTVVAGDLATLPFDAGVRPDLVGENDRLFVLQEIRPTSIPITGELASYSFERSEWQLLATPPPLQQSDAILVGGGLVVVGLTCSGEPPCETGDVVAQTFDPDANTWIRGETLATDVDSEDFSPGAVGPLRDLAYFITGRNLLGIDPEGRVKVELPVPVRLEETCSTVAGIVGIGPPDNAQEPPTTIIAGQGGDALVVRHLVNAEGDDRHAAVLADTASLRATEPFSQPFCTAHGVGLRSGGTVHEFDVTARSWTEVTLPTRPTAWINQSVPIDPLTALLMDAEILIISGSVAWIASSLSPVAGAVPDLDRMIAAVGQRLLLYERRGNGPGRLSEMPV